MAADHIEITGTVVEVLPKGNFRIQNDENPNHIILAYLGGKVYMNKVRIVLQDKVLVSVSQYDSSKGIIKRRL